MIPTEAFPNSMSVTAEFTSQALLDEQLRDAAGEGNLGLMQQWVARGANPKAVNPAARIQQTALCDAAAAKADSEECVKWLWPLSDPKHVSQWGSALHWALMGGNLAALRLLIPVCDASALDKEGQTALMKAVNLGSVEGVKLMIPASDLSERGGEKNEGRNALMLAVVSKNQNSGKIIALLAANMTDEELDAVDAEGCTALAAAVATAPGTGELNFTPLLGRANANIGAGEPNGAPLGIAVEFNILAAVQALIPFTELRRAPGVMSPVERAAKRGHWEIAETLAPVSPREDADRALAMANGKMPLWLARCEEEALRETVREHGASPHSRTAAKRPPRAL